MWSTHRNRMPSKLLLYLTCLDDITLHWCWVGLSIKSKSHCPGSEAGSPRIANPETSVKNRSDTVTKPWPSVIRSGIPPGGFKMIKTIGVVWYGGLLKSGANRNNTVAIPAYPGLCLGATVIVRDYTGVRVHKRYIAYHARCGHDWKSLSIAFLAISDQCTTFNFCKFFYKMAAGGHFGWPKITLNRSFRHFRWIHNFCFCWIFSAIFKNR